MAFGLEHCVPRSPTSDIAPPTDSTNIEMLSSLAPHYVEVHSYNKTIAGFNTTLAAFLIGAQANAFWNLGPGAWQCDDWDVRMLLKTMILFPPGCRRGQCCRSSATLSFSWFGGDATMWPVRVRSGVARRI